MKVRLIDICQPKQWQTISTDKLLQHGYPVYGANGVIGYYDKYNHADPTVMITCRGATCGTVNISEPFSYINGNAMSLDNLSNNVLINYLFYQLINYDFKKVISGSAQPQITREGLSKVYIELHSLEEQKIIANNLEKIDCLIDKRKQQLEKLDLLIKSKFIEMFGVINSPKYPLQSIGDLCEFVKDGTHQTPCYTVDKNKGYKFLSSKDVTSGVIDWNDIKYIPAELHNELYARISPRRNDILLAKNGTTGIAALVDTDEVFDIYVSLALLRFKKGVNIKYILYAINSKDTKQQFDESLKGIGVPNLHLGEIKKTKLIIPPIEIQNEFATFVDKVEKTKETIKQSFEKLETLKKALMQKYF